MNYNPNKLKFPLSKRATASPNLYLSATSSAAGFSLTPKYLYIFCLFLLLLLLLLLLFQPSVDRFLSLCNYVY